MWDVPHNLPLEGKELRNVFSWLSFSIDWGLSNMCYGLQRKAGGGEIVICYGKSVKFMETEKHSWSWNWRWAQSTCYRASIASAACMISNSRVDSFYSPPRDQVITLKVLGLYYGASGKIVFQFHHFIEDLALCESQLYMGLSNNSTTTIPPSAILLWTLEPSY